MKPRSKISCNKAQKAFERWLVQFRCFSSGDSIYPFYIHTHYGNLSVGFDIADTRTYELTGAKRGAKRADWLNMCFQDVDRAHHNVKDMNPYTGKWNHQIFIDKTDEGLKYVTGLMQAQGIVTIGE